MAAAQGPAPVRPPTPTAPNGGAPGARLPGTPPRDLSAAPKGTSALRGTVTRADTGAPLRRAQVRAFAAELREQRVAMTDDNGRYELKELPAGRYTVNASKGGYVSLQFGQRRPFEQGQPLELADGQTLEKVDFVLPRGSVITGRIVDELGEPMTGAMVQAMRYRFVNGARRLTPMNVMQTDDRGEFRIYGLAPGDYYVSAALQSLNGGVSDDRIGYAPTYYPGTAVSADAQRITVGLGEEVAGIVFAVAPARMASISGVAHDAEGKPLPNAIIVVISKGDDGLPRFGGGGTQTHADGSFTVGSLAPGSYTIQARSLASPNGEVAFADVAVNGTDINGLQLNVVRGSTVRGRIRFESGAPPPDLKPADVRVGSISPTGAPVITSGPSIASVNDDWTFTLANLTGSLLLRVNPPQTWAVKSITLNGMDYTDSAIDFRGDDVEGLDVVLTQKISELSGSVVDDRGGKVTDATVVYFADDRDKWVPFTRWVRSARPDQDGRYKIRGLPPGRYIAVALDYLEPGEEADPEMLDRLRSRGIRVSVGEGDTRQVDLKVIAGA
jgi:protocatechuate 3,4-dioxygenase beta subunit